MSATFGGIIRKPVEQDLPTIKNILSEWLRDAETGNLFDVDITTILDQVAQNIAGDERRQYLVAEQDGQIRGVMGLTGQDIAPEFSEAGERSVELLSAYVTGAARGRGVGRALADALEVSARSQGFTNVVVVSGSRSREFGYAFWERRYGRPALFEQNFYGPGQERVAWRVPL